MTGSSKPPPRRSAERRDDIVRAARTVFLPSGDQDCGLADVATEGGLTRASVSRSFPGGKPELFLAVVDLLVNELHGRLRYASRVPFSPARRMEHVIGALFAFFEETPRAFRLLYRDVW